jgi:4-amino-4-deoxy-L-arabinose transferase-like glycosyltransferase
MQTSGNLWYLVTQILHLQVPGYLPPAIALAALAACGAWLWLQARRIPPFMLVLAATPVFGLCFQILYRMTAPPYLAPAVAAIAAVLVMRRTSTAALAVWSGLWSFDGTVWVRVRDALPESAPLRAIFDLYELVLVATTVIALAWTLSLVSRRGGRSQAMVAGPEVTHTEGAAATDRIAFK